MASHSPFMFHLYIKARSVPILSAIKNRYYKVTDGALRACGETTSVVFRPYNSMWSITTCFGIDFKKTKNKCINMRKKLKKRILGVEESASQQEIEKVYHKLALRLHPDTNPGNEPKRSFSGCRRLYPFLEIQRKELYMMRLTSVMTIQSSGVLPNNVQKAAFLFFYIKPTENDKKLRKFFPEEKGPISNIDPIGNSPVIIKKR
uniref:J domain-containing protein n=1 Tax=Zea mays TaxID=4577 RepID=A0A804MUJ6_MAIZE